MGYHDMIDELSFSPILYLQLINFIYMINFIQLINFMINFMIVLNFIYSFTTEQRKLQDL